MRRSTAAALGTLTGAALIVGVRMSVETPEAPIAAAPAANDVAAPAPSKAADGGKAGGKVADKADKKEEEAAEEPEGKFKNGTYEGTAKYVYGTIEIQLKVTKGNISAVEVGYPTANDSGTINPPAVAKLKQETLKAQSADVDAVSGATLTSEAYLKSLQAAIDQAA